MKEVPTKSFEVSRREYAEVAARTCVSLSPSERSLFAALLDRTLAKSYDKTGKRKLSKF